MISDEKINPSSSRLYSYLEHTDKCTVTMTYDNEILQAVWYLKDEMKIFAFRTLQCETRAFLESRGFPKGGEVRHIYQDPCRIIWTCGKTTKQ